MENALVPAELSFLCKVLSPWTKEDVQLRETAGRVNWQAVAVLANRSNLAPALRVALKARSLWAYAPAELRALLDELCRFNAGRNELLEQELLEVAELLNRASITPMPLKGAAALATRLFSDSAVRFMWDLDVFVPEGTIRRAVRALEQGGWFVPQKYARSAENLEAFYGAKHFAPLIRAGCSAPVELHRRLVTDRWEVLLDTDEVWRESSLFGSSVLPGISLAVMSPTHQIIHCFIHSELSHANHRDFRLDLRQLHHFAHLCLCHRDTVDWDRVAMLLGKGNVGRTLQAYLHLAGRLFGVETPLSTAPNRYVRRHSFTTLLLSQGRCKWLRILKSVFERLGECLAEHRLNEHHPVRAGSSPKWRRIRRIVELLGRWSRLGPWKELIANLNRRYDSLG